MKQLILLSFFLTCQLQAATILVSDIDDTIKVSYVLDKDSLAANVPMVQNVFIGMPELYHEIAGLPEFKNIKYLSNAPRGRIAELHQKFLQLNNFPRGELVVRRWRDLDEGNAHKLNSLRRFIKIYRPDELILIGDNGEADAEIYYEISSEYSLIPNLTYIRQAYSSYGYSNNFANPLQPGQIPFATSVDIALDLFKRGRLSQVKLSSFIVKVVPAILREGWNEERGKPMAFPEWYDCRDFDIKEVPLLIDPSANDLLQKYMMKVNFRCGRGPYGD